MDIFKITDAKNGKYPDLCDIALKEDWANGLIYCDMEGFAIGEDGCLYLLDECGNYRIAPYGRFRISGDADGEPRECPFCGNPNVTIVRRAGEASKYVKRVVCPCGAEGPITPFNDESQEAAADKLATELWNMALRMPTYTR